MGAKQDAAREEGQPFYQRVNSIQIQVVRRLVEQKHVRLQPGDLGEGDAAFLAAGQQVHGAQRKRPADPEGSEVRTQRLLRVVREALGEVQKRREREVQAVNVVLAEVGPPHLRVSLDDPLGRGQAPRNEVEERGLARAIGPDKTDARLHVKAKREVVEERGTARVPKRDVVEAEHRGGDGLRGWEVENILRVLLLQLDDSHALERFDARLHERGTLGVEAEAVDKGLHVGALAGRALRRGRVAAQLLRAGALESVVVAAVSDNAAAVQVADVGAHAVQKACL